MQNWFLKYKIGDKFYKLMTDEQYKFASVSSDFKKKDLRRWFRIHKMLADVIGLDPANPEYLDTFVELSDILRELTDRLGRLPNKNEFLSAWHTWGLYQELKDPNAKGYEHDGYEVGKIRPIDYKSKHVDEIEEKLVA